MSESNLKTILLTILIPICFYKIWNFKNKLGRSKMSNKELSEIKLSLEKTIFLNAKK